MVVWLMASVAWGGVPAELEELFHLLRTNLVDVTEAELSGAAARGLVRELEPRVYLETAGLQKTNDASAPPRFKSTVFDQAFGYIRLPLIERGSEEKFRAAFAAMNRTNALKG